ncbi:hypothetical protein BCR37DRAFT_385716 [Protomyces lactucae-debilis]|uniref:DUF6729 domain-containing protein n=1 Tax=Protomyces lactucae-debilis TaxID=2754530 RepID=A0A1Y2FU70_PROLT|nr:uncharacterized protein BCR37DRAFT_385716 [Protomyces lactucae-debilis]ORY86245.1 hypothetical protein BCR37DRAFT_385716 [Protomyces lactucae-debilis]
MARPKGSKSRPGAGKPGRASAVERAAKAPGQTRLTSSAALEDAVTPIEDGDAALNNVEFAPPAITTGQNPASSSAVARDEDDVGMAALDDSEVVGNAHNASTAVMAPDATEYSPSAANDLPNVQRDNNTNQVAGGLVNNDDPSREATTKEGLDIEESDGNSIEVDFIDEIRAKVQDKRIKLYEEGSSLWIHPPDPTIHLIDNPNDVKVLFHPSVFVWHPALLSRSGNKTGKLDEESRLPCPRCKDGLRFKGWCDSPTARRIHDDGRHFLLMAYCYCCKNPSCSLETISAADTELLESLPYGLQLAFPAILSHRSGISKRLFERFQDSIANGCGPEHFRQLLNNSALRRFQTLNEMYLDNIKVCLSGKQTDFQTSFDANMPKSSDEFRSFGEFNDPLQYNGVVPSVHWLTDLYTKEMARRKPPLDKRSPIPFGPNSHVRNLGLPRPPEQPVRLINLAASAPVPRPVDLCAPEIFIEKNRQSSDIHRACKRCSLKTCGAYHGAFCVLHPKNLSRAERSLRSGKFRPEVLRLWNCWHVLQYERKRSSSSLLPTACTINRTTFLDKLHSDLASRSSKLLGFLQSDANFIQDLLKAYIEERIVYNPFVQGSDL